MDAGVFESAVKCPQRQCSQDTIENYHVGKVYQYDYQVEAITEMRSTSSGAPSRVNIMARAMIHVLSPCQFSLKVLLKMYF